VSQEADGGCRKQEPSSDHGVVALATSQLSQTNYTVTVDAAGEIRLFKSQLGSKVSLLACMHACHPDCTHPGAWQAHVLLDQPVTDLFGLSEEQVGTLNLQPAGNMVRPPMLVMLVNAWHAWHACQCLTCLSMRVATSLWTPRH